MCVQDIGPQSDGLLFVSHYMVAVLCLPPDETALVSFRENFWQFTARSKPHVCTLKMEAGFWSGTKLYGAITQNNLFSLLHGQ
jgi:hypothetical protein